MEQLEPEEFGRAKEVEALLPQMRCLLKRMMEMSLEVTRVLQKEYEILDIFLARSSPQHGSPFVSLPTMPSLRVGD
jgi:hypothetical protein